MNRGFRLKNWYIGQAKKGCIGHGNVYSNPKFPDGLQIHTSIVQTVELGAAGHVELHTKNNVYVCQISECLFQRQQQLDILPFSIADAKAKHYAGLQITDNCIVIEITSAADQYIRNAVLYSEFTGPQALPWEIHLGMFEDSVLIGTGFSLEDRECVDIRYTVGNNNTMEFYSLTAPEQFPIYVRNTGSKTITCSTSQNEETAISPGETTRV